jgi:hypothetical protein
VFAAEHCATFRVLWKPLWCASPDQYRCHKRVTFTHADGPSSPGATRRDAKPPGLAWSSSLWRSPHPDYPPPSATALLPVPTLRSTNLGRGRCRTMRGHYRGALRARPANRRDHRRGHDEIATERLIRPACPTGGRVVVGHVVCLAVEAAGDRDRVQPFSQGNHLGAVVSGRPESGRR